MRVRVVRCELLTREDALSYVREQRQSLPVVERAQDVAERIMQHIEAVADAAKGRMA